MYRLSRDPFARLTHVKAIVPKHEQSRAGCHWCGQTDRRLFWYGVDPDSGRLYLETEQFCSQSCHKAYTS